MLRLVCSTAQAAEQTVFAVNGVVDSWWGVQLTS